MDVNIDSSINREFNTNKMKRRMRLDFKCKDINVKMQEPENLNSCDPKRRRARKKRQIY